MPLEAGAGLEAQAALQGGYLLEGEERKVVILDRRDEGFLADRLEVAAAHLQADGAGEGASRLLHQLDGDGLRAGD